ncbi:MAG: class I SAM-dependent methyltransferase [Candidatus Thorarchaeota archaeon]|nr:class I SAM-dependent methyltransferase [Candidatus Thorarchaeota archaeon]
MALICSLTSINKSEISSDEIGGNVMFSYFSDKEYQRVFQEFEHVRKKISLLLNERLSRGNQIILDLLAGHGYLSAEFAKLCPSCAIHCTGLKNDLDSFLALKASDLYPLSIWDNIQYTECDVTGLPFDDEYFDLVVNFLGLEDVMMTRERSGLLSTISEVTRVAKRTGLVQISVVEYGDTPEERLAEDIWGNIGLNAIFLSKEFYIDAFAEHGFHLADEAVFEVRKKMTYDQASEELQFACEQAPIIFKEYNVKAIPFEELMSRFETRIKQHGMAYYPNIRVLLFLSST